MTDEELIAQCRQVARDLFASSMWSGSDLVRLAGGLLRGTADRLERVRVDREAFDAYARQNADLHRENMRLRDRVAELEAAPPR